MFEIFLLKQQSTWGHPTPSLCPRFLPQHTPPSCPVASRAGGVGNMGHGKKSSYNMGPCLLEGCPPNLSLQKPAAGRPGGDQQPARHTGSMWQNWTPNPDPLTPKTMAFLAGCLQEVPGAAWGVMGGHQGPAQGRRSLSLI